MRKLILGSCLVLVGLGITWLIVTRTFQATGGPAEVQAKTAYSFTDFFGVNIHLNYASYKNVFSSIVLPKISELGVKHFRDVTPLVGHVSNPNTEYTGIADKMRQVSATGADFVLTTDPASGSHDPVNGPFLDLLNNLMNGGTFHNNTLTTAGGVKLIGVEGPNEWDHCPSTTASCPTTGSWIEKLTAFRGTDWDTQLVTYVKNLYSKVKNDGRTGSLSIVAPSLSYVPEYQGVTTTNGNLYTYLKGQLYGTVTYGNAHLYCYNRTDCSSTYASVWRSFFIPKKILITETGYPTDPGGDWSVSERQQNSFLMRDVLNFYDLNYVTRVYLYELMDLGSGSTPTLKRESSFGLVRTNNTVKPLYSTLKNTLSILSDTSESFTPGKLPFSSSNSAVKTTLLQKKDGVYYLLLRREDNLRTSGTAVDQAVNTTLKFGSAHSVTLFTPSGGSGQTKYLNDTTEFELSVSDDLTIAKIADPVPAAPGGGGSTSSSSSSSSSTSTNSNTATNNNGTATNNNSSSTSSDPKTTTNTTTNTAEPAATATETPSGAVAETYQEVVKTAKKTPVAFGLAVVLALGIFGFAIYLLIRNFRLHHASRLHPQQY